jgi:hypothetical protein
LHRFLQPFVIWLENRELSGFIHGLLEVVEQSANSGGPVGTHRTILPCGPQADRGASSCISVG